MTDRPFRVIDGGGKPEPDPEALERAEMACKAIRTAAETGEWFYAVIESEEGWGVTFYGDALELASTVEEVARDHKRGALGFGIGCEE